MRTLRISVRRLVEFLLRTGDIGAIGDWRSSIEAMRAGSNIHRMLQASAGPSYQAEVSLAGSFFFPNGTFDPYAARLEIREEAVSDQQGFFLRVEGRADGIVDDGTGPIVIDEIKGVSRDVAGIREPDPIHEAQALCYAYLYLRSSRGSAALSTAFDEQVTVRLTYASMTTGEVRQIELPHSVPAVESWFFSLLETAQRWAAWRVRHDELRASSLASLEFPLAARDGQREVMDAVAAAVHGDGHLYVQAPTGSGKTIATMYPALKAMGAGEAAHIAYLTAKTITRRSALECLDLLRQQGAAANVLVITARNKICPLRSKERSAAMRARPLSSLCNPIECPLARGHYESANDALYEAIATHDVLDFDCIREVAARHHVCPYELQRDAARWSDVIICDYHFAFSPSAGLLGISNEPGGADTVLLVDEAHNLAERMRDMYSAELSIAELCATERLVRTAHDLAQLANALRSVVAAFPTWDNALPPNTRRGSGRQQGRHPHAVVHLSDAFADALSALLGLMDTALEKLGSPTDGTRGNGRQQGAPVGRSIETLLALQDANRGIRAFLSALQRAETGYVTFLAHSESGRRLKIYCVDPSHDLAERLEQARAAVFFSGTLLPMDYHRKLLAAQEEDASVYARSSFDPRHRQVLIGTDVTTRFSKRGPKLYARIAAYLMALTHAHPGNYLAFLPSYAMVEETAKALRPLLDGRTRVVRQRPNMRENERDGFVNEFRTSHDGQSSLVGLCVLGGIFGESIDLPGKALIGVVVVGTGMPGISDEREVIKDYFDARGGKGFSYAYTYPGMVKVLQAAGRLIRTEEDRGVVLLLDSRFCEEELQKAFPEEWEDVRTCTLETMPSLLKS